MYAIRSYYATEIEGKGAIRAVAEAAGTLLSGARHEVVNPAPRAGTGGRILFLRPKTMEPPRA